MFRKDKNEFLKFQALTRTEDRQQFFKKWIIESLAFYGLASIVILFIIGEASALFQLPDFLHDISQSLAFTNDEDKFYKSLLKGFLLSIVPLLLIGTPIATLVVTYLQHKNNNSAQPPNEAEMDTRNLDYLIPRNSKERLWTSLLSINAGFSEELFFRLLAPILIFSITGNATIAILASVIWFGLAHYYQGITGIIVTSIVGLILFYVYISTQSIWLTMLVHAVVDLNSLALGPWFKEWLERNNRSE